MRCGRGWQSLQGEAGAVTTDTARVPRIFRCKEITEAEGIKKRWQQCTGLYKKGLNDQDNHDGMVIHLEPDILECEVKWALGSITTNKVNGKDGIPAELF